MKIIIPTFQRKKIKCGYGKNVRNVRKANGASRNSWDIDQWSSEKKINFIAKEKGQKGNHQWKEQRLPLITRRSRMSHLFVPGVWFPWFWKEIFNLGKRSRLPPVIEGFSSAVSPVAEFYSLNLIARNSMAHTLTFESNSCTWRIIARELPI